ncbi:MAG TPA: hypothetical protein VGQ33_22900, partial [Vicinamibacteria bacterium]|nr:hypothetical protein [Vicinamibacteria bacterium]
MTATRARDFTLAKYDELCGVLVAADYPSLSMTAYVERAPMPPRFVLLRHDVETSPGLAVRMAEIESRHRLSSTYFLRARRRGFPGEAIARLRALG